ncbi:hypothetical protein [Acinetobacter johnsonii]|uniref:DUF2570 domain-containing protein n=1 Tax=Acinetobacter johnsonii TaxID=40214 RepID=A0AAW6RZU7_ACIJO|nr:hypothetical protein [Acinetobacter johnsonii]MDG9788747.1 hypothetical protein [Acinetobacter johnsonii]MDG9800745.1 hypothetical protein [Acinetobacter johnsonii]
MPILIVLWKFKYWIAIAIFFVLWLCQIAYTNHLSGQLKEADSKCTAKIQEIEQKHLKALAEKQNKINEVSADYEAERSKQRVEVETVTREVQKIIDRPVYQQHCFDDDGVSAINSLITNDPSEPL